MQFSFCFTRSMVKTRSTPSQCINSGNLKCVICGQYSRNGIRSKYRISETQRAENLQNAAKYFMDEVYIRVSDLDSVSKIFAADLYCHSSCYSNYIRKWNTEISASENNNNSLPSETLVELKKNVFGKYIGIIGSSIQKGRGLSLSDIRDMINNENKLNFRNSEIKTFLVEAFGEEIKFCDPERKNQSQFVFSSSVKVEDVINFLRNLDVARTAGTEIRKVLLETDFELDDKFCDAQELQKSWTQMVIPDILVTFFASLFNVSKTKILKDEIKPQDFDCLSDNDEDEEDDTEEVASSKLMMKINSLFQIMFYQVTDGKHKTPLQIMNAHGIYERCRSRELITAFNRQSVCISYNTMKKLRSDLAKYTIHKSSENEIPLPNHFDSNCFTIAAMDNFDNSDKNSLSGMMHAHDTALTLFQEKPKTLLSKPKKSSIDLVNVPKLNKLPCQELMYFRPFQKLPISDSFTIDNDLYSMPKSKDDFENYELIINCAQCNIDKSEDKLIPSWAGIKSLLSEVVVPEMHVGFLPFIPSPVTEYSTVFTAMVNFTKLVKQLKQDALPLFCDEGVFRIMIDIYLQKQDQFKSIIPMLGGFHTAKCFEHCIGKYIQGSGLEQSLKQTRVFGVKVADAVLNGTNYTRSLKGILILSNAIEMLKWNAFLELNKCEQFDIINEDLKLNIVLYTLF